MCTHLGRIRACSTMAMRFEGWGDALRSVFDLGHRFGFDPVRERWASYSSSCSGSAITGAYELPSFPVYLPSTAPFNFTSSFCNSNSKQSLRLFHHDFHHGSILPLVPPIQLPAINPDPIADFECALLPCRPAAQIRNINFIHVLIGFLQFGKLWVWK